MEEAVSKRVCNSSVSIGSDNSLINNYGTVELKKLTNIAYMKGGIRYLRTSFNAHNIL